MTRGRQRTSDNPIYSVIVILNFLLARKVFNSSLFIPFFLPLMDWEDISLRKENTVKEDKELMF